MQLISTQRDATIGTAPFYGIPTISFIHFCFMVTLPPKKNILLIPAQKKN
jgi:hypothetical protein